MYFLHTHAVVDHDDNDFSYQFGQSQNVLKKHNNNIHNSLCTIILNSYKEKKDSTFFDALVLR